MNINLIHLDNTLLRQTQFMNNCERLGACNLDFRNIGPDVRLWSDVDNTGKLRKRLQHSLKVHPKTGPVITWLGSGDFHHVSALLIAQVSQTCSQNTTVIHFDNHPDWVVFRKGIHCGSWASYLLKTNQVKKIVSLGISSNDLAWPEFKGADLQSLAAAKIIVFPLNPPRTLVFRHYGEGPAHTQIRHTIKWSLMDRNPTSKFLNTVLEQIGPTSVYITIDKDVLSSGYAITNWDQGKLHLDNLLEWLRALTRHCNVAGIDIVGDRSPVKFCGSKATRLMKRAEVWMDHPKTCIDDDEASRINEKTNSKILSVLGECL